MGMGCGGDVGDRVGEKSGRCLGKVGVQFYWEVIRDLFLFFQLCWMFCVVVYLFGVQMQSYYWYMMGSRWGFGFRSSFDVFFVRGEGIVFLWN